MERVGRNRRWRCDLLGQRLGVGYKEAERARLGIERRRRLIAQNLLRRVGLAVFYMAFVAARQNRNRVVATKPAKVMIEIAGIVERIGNHDHRPLAAGFRQHNGSGRAGQTIDAHPARVGQRRTQRLLARFVNRNVNHFCGARMAL